MCSLGPPQKPTNSPAPTLAGSPAAQKAPDAVPLAQLEHDICELQAHIEAATCRWLELLGEFDAREGWSQSGSRSCAHWLSWRCSVTLGTAREHLRVARRLRELPLIREAFAAGQLTYCKVRALTRVVTSKVEAEFLEIARHATGAQLEKLARGYGRVMDATAAAAQTVHERRFLSWSWEDDGSLRVQGRLPAEDGALLIKAIEAREADVAEDPRADSRFGARRADALMALARSGADVCELVVHVDAETLSSDSIVERSEVERGPSLAAETARRLGCDAAVVAIVERDGEPLSVGRRARIVPPALRRALRARDGGCRFPGCTHQRFMHAHHIRHWARGGATELSNLVQLCSYHHRLVHEGGFRAERSAHGVRFRGRDGRVLSNCGGERPPRGSVAELRRANADQGLVADADTCRALSAGDSLDYGLAVEVLARRALGPP